MGVSVCEVCECMSVYLHHRFGARDGKLKNKCYFIEKNR